MAGSLSSNKPLPEPKTRLRRSAKVGFRGRIARVYSADARDDKVVFAGPAQRRARGSGGAGAGLRLLRARADLDAELVRRRGRRARRSVRPGPRPRLHPARALAAVRGGLARGLHHRRRRPVTARDRGDGRHHGLGRARLVPVEEARPLRRPRRRATTSRAPGGSTARSTCRGRRRGRATAAAVEAAVLAANPALEPGRRDRDLSRRPDRGGAGLPHARARAARLRARTSPTTPAGSGRRRRCRRSGSARPQRSRRAARRFRSRVGARPSMAARPRPISAMPARWRGSQHLAEHCDAEEDRRDRDEEGDEQQVRGAHPREQAEVDDVGERGGERGEPDQRGDDGPAGRRQRPGAVDREGERHEDEARGRHLAGGARQRRHAEAGQPPAVDAGERVGERGAEAGELGEPVRAEPGGAEHRRDPAEADQHASEARRA